MNTAARRESAALALRLPVALDPGIVDALVSELIGLLQSCFSDPTVEALERIREPAYGVMGLRRYLWRREVRAAVARSWKGPPELLPTAQDAVLARLRVGVSAPQLAALYARH